MMDQGKVGISIILSLHLHIYTTIMGSCQILIQSSESIFTTIMNHTIAIINYRSSKGYPRLNNQNYKEHSPLPIITIISLALA